ncbi:acyl-CoA dehydrogenase [Pseudooceanicola sp. 216_PA32_1]|uniref:Acyl-CoA dehydrogenase n=1 Tax=Pseudooceanicola pacificus TaxID=2676438 RepID=A0A844WDZ6_9RHOB|nr:acyl-CoA dehydrogenase family protein [Pseudooceanicola pacificus]MWB78030.1 acyl-CoA dehydrogenase [Pseudooceanicola pacificus]
MDLALTHEQSLLVKTVRDFIARELRPLEQDVEDRGALDPADARRIYEASRALGLYATNIPQEFGGGGLSAFETMLVEEQFGHTTDILVRRAFGNVYEVLLSCEGAQIDRWLKPCVTGARTCSIAFTETGAGSDAAGIQTRAVRDGSGWRLSGSKHFISDGAHSDFFIVSAVTDPQAGAKGISLFLVDKGMPGFRPGADQPMMGLRGTSHLELAFDDVALGPEHLLGQEGAGLKLALSVLGRVRLAQVGARAVGKATHILRMALDHARERKQFGQRLGDFQMVQQMLADSAMEINAARLALWQAAAEIDRGLDPRERISAVKVQASEALGRVVDRTMQIFGGLGYAKGLPIERYYRDARVYRIFDGASEIHRAVMARGMLKGATGLFDPFDV